LPYFHCICAEMAICALPFKIPTPPSNSVTPITRGYFCDRWSLASYITSGFSRQSVLERKERKTRLRNDLLCVVWDVKTTNLTRLKSGFSRYLITLDTQ